MRAMVISKIVSLEQNAKPLQLVDLPVPEPAAGEILIRVSTCGVCHTELDEIEGRAPPSMLPIVPGHQVIGHVAATGDGAGRFAVGDRVGVGWIFHSCGGEFENLSADFRATGRDAHGGYAEFMTVGESFAHAIPETFADAEAAPLLCAGSVGFRALKLTGMSNGQSLGLSGFGASGHIVLQLARYLYPDSEIFVFARKQSTREFALELGADWCGDTDAIPPTKLNAIIDSTPAWKPVLSSLASLLPGGRLVINAIGKESADIDLMAGIRYADHLWMEKEIKSVANVTADDIATFLEIAAGIPLRPAYKSMPLEAANEALMGLRTGDIHGALVLTISV